MIATATEQKLHQLLTDAFSPTQLQIINESHHHAGHAEAGTSGESHFRVIIAAKTLNDLPRVKQHQAIYHACDALINEPIHALAIEVKQA